MYTLDVFSRIMAGPGGTLLSRLRVVNTITLKFLSRRIRLTLNGQGMHLGLYNLPPGSATLIPSLHAVSRTIPSNPPRRGRRNTLERI